VKRNSLVRRPEDFHGFAWLFINALILGLGIPLVMILLLASADASRGSGGGRLGSGAGDLILLLAIGLTGLVYIGFVLMRPVRHWSRIRTAAHCLAWGMLIATGFTLAVLIAGVFAGGVRTEGVLLIGAFAIPGTGVAFCLLWWGKRTSQRVVHGRVVVLQDGTRCPQCAYSLIGNTSMVCPECGNPFTFADLGTTAEAFAGVSRARLTGAPVPDPLIDIAPNRQAETARRVGMGAMLAALAIGICLTIALTLQAAGMRLRGPALVVLPVGVFGVMLAIGVAVDVRRMRRWQDAMFFGASFGCIVASVVTAFLVAEAGMRGWLARGGTWLGILAACMGAACVTAWTGLMWARRTRRQPGAEDRGVDADQS
jgi:hypothetical protein